jgi:DNA repair ATPase RecN
MDYERELNRLQSDLDKAFDKIENNSLAVAKLQATYKEQYDHIINSLGQINRDMQQLNTSIRKLESLATQGRTSLKTLLWVGGFIAAIITFILNITGYWFNK